MVVLLVLFAKSAGKIWMECVYTRGYEICVFGISIPLRVYQRERRMTSKPFPADFNYSKRNKKRNNNKLSLVPKEERCYNSIA